MVRFEVRFDCGDDDRSPAWVVLRFEHIGSPDARYGTMVAEFTSRVAAEDAAAAWNRSVNYAKFTLSPSLVA